MANKLWFEEEVRKLCTCKNESAQQSKTHAKDCPAKVFLIERGF